MDEQQLRKEFQEFADAGMWQGEDEHTKNFGVGTITDWWIEKVSKSYQRGREEGSAKKGCEFNGKSEFCNEKCQPTPTPHESEDWEASFNPLSFQDFKDGRYYTNIEKLKDFIRKVYQRGREEGQIQLDEVYEETVKKEVLSLAVQEIGKGKKEAKTVSQFMKPDKFNQGLDKAIEIISGLKSKE